MKPLQQTSLPVLRRLLAGQPTTTAKIHFAWQVVAGAPLARHGALDWRDDGVLHVRPSGASWGRELRANRDVLLERLHELLGRNVVTRLVIDADGGPGADRLRPSE